MMGETIVDGNSFTVVPNAKKYFLRSATYFAEILVIALLIILFLYIQVGFEWFTEVLAAFGIEASSGRIFLYAIIVFVLVAAILLALNYSHMKSLKYLMYDTKMIHSEIQGIVFLLKQEIPYNNITRITFSREGLMNKILDCGTITIELSGLRISSIKLESLDNPENLSQMIQQKINQFKMMKQMQFQEQQKIQGIMKNF